MQDADVEVAAKLLCHGVNVRVTDGCIGNISDLPTMLQKVRDRDSVFAEDHVLWEATDGLQGCSSVSPERVRKEQRLESESSLTIGRLHLRSGWIVEQARVSLNCT